MPTIGYVFIIVTVIIIAAFVAIYFFGRKLQKKQEASDAQMQAAAQTISMLVIDKKRMKLKEANLPKVVLDQTPKYLRGSKVPIVKAKIGPKVMNLMCDAKIYDLVPVKKEIKAVVSGIYIMEVKGLRGNLEQRKEKKTFMQKVTGVFKKEKN